MWPTARLSLASVVLSGLVAVGPLTAQDVAPLFQQAGSVVYETYNGVNSPVFGEYFEMLVDKYKDTDAHGWGLYRENATVWYRISPLANGLQTLMEVQAARSAGFQEFNDAERALWNTAWATRHVSIFNAAPAMSVVPEGFSVADIQALPYNRVTVYYLKWDQAPAFRQALRARAELDRDANIDDFVFTAWNGGIGTEAQTVMIRVSAASLNADRGPNQAARRAARESYRAEWSRLSQIMNNAAYHIERHDQTRIGELSHSPGR